MARSSKRTLGRADLNDLAAFAAVARHRSFRRAARETGLAVSTLSERLRELEARVGVRLLNRTTRSVAPTAAGEQLLKRIALPLEELTDAAKEAGSLAGVPSGTLRINAPWPAVALVLAPMMAEFLAQYPQISVDIVDETSLIDIVSAGFDAGVRWEESLAKDMVAVSLGPPERYVLVASPRFLASRARPRTPKDLLGQPCITTRFPSRAQVPWEFEKNGRVVRILPDSRLQATNIPLMLRAAIDDAGYLVTFEGFARDALAAGQLVPLLEDWLPSFPGPFLYYPSRRQNPSSLNAFIGFVREWRARRK